MYITQIRTVQQYKSDVGFKTLVEGVNDNLYFIPKYQRKFRWKKEQVQELARSLVRGYPIPPIYAYRNSDGQLEILDGQQRVMSLFFYYIGKFIDTQKFSAVDYRTMDIENMKYGEALEKSFDLVEMHTYLENDDETENKTEISYGALSVELRRKVDYTTITVVELRWDTGEERITDIQRIFENLNSKGTKLSPQEIRNGVYNCPFYDMLRTVNMENNDWKKIRGRESDKEEDMEMLLRLCTVEKNVSYKQGEFIINNYHSNYSDWMDEFSESSLKMSEEEIEHYRLVLEDFFARFQLSKVLGLQKALIESLFVVIEKANLEVQITAEVVDAILNDSRYKENSRQGMVQKGKMNERWKGTYEVVSKYAISYPIRIAFLLERTHQENQRQLSVLCRRRIESFILLMR